MINNKKRIHPKKSKKVEQGLKKVQTKIYNNKKVKSIK